MHAAAAVSQYLKTKRMSTCCQLKAPWYRADRHSRIDAAPLCCILKIRRSANLQNRQVGMASRRIPASDWYKTAFRYDYLKVYPHRNDQEARRQVDFLLGRMEVLSSCDVLDLGCGDGRHSLELARRGYRVTGLDLSDSLLGRARRRAAEEGLDITFVQGDMRDPPGISAFDLVVNFFTSFGYFQEDGENARVLEAISRSLRPGGRFLMDYLNREFVISTLVAADSRTVEGMEVDQRRWITGDPSAPGGHVRINKHVRIREEGTERSYDESVRMFTLEELDAMMDQAGLKITQTYGDFDGSPVGVSQPRNILLGQTSQAGQTSSTGPTSSSRQDRPASESKPRTDAPSRDKKTAKPCP